MNRIKKHRTSICGEWAILVVLLAALVPLFGCATTGKSLKTENPPSGFEKQRSEQESLSNYAASVGRANPSEKKEAPKGETFLMSSKAREIYNNTER